VVFDNEKTIRSSEVPATMQNRSKNFPDQIGAGKTIFFDIIYSSGVCLKLNILTVKFYSPYQDQKTKGNQLWDLPLW
jgi:hypothetical protein